MAIPALTVTPHSAAQAYRATEAGQPGDFGGVLARTLGSVVQSGQAAEAQSMKAIAGTGNVTEMVTTVAQAELALQTTMAVRDRVVQAYQDIMRMPL